MQVIGQGSLGYERQNSIPRAYHGPVGLAVVPPIVCLPDVTLGVRAWPHSPHV